MPGVGVEPTRPIGAADFKSAASAIPPPGLGGPSIIHGHDADDVDMMIPIDDGTDCGGDHLGRGPAGRDGNVLSDAKV